MGPCVAQASEISWEGGVTAVYQDVDASGVESEFTGSADLFITIPRSGGEWLIYVEGSSSPNPNGVSAFYPTVNGDARSVLSRNGGGGVQVSEFNYTWLLKNDRSFMAGLIDPSAWLDRGRIANDENKHFLNGSFVHNATIAFPDYTLGGVFRWLGSANRPEVTVVLSSSDGIADTPERSYQDLLNSAIDRRGAFIGAGASWLYKRTSWRLGGWLRTDRQQVAGSETESEVNYGGYGVFGWQSGANALNLRLGISNDNVAIASRFAAIAYERKTPLGLFGIGAAQTFISRDFRQEGRDDAFDAEAFFRIPVFADAGHITPSIQYVENPGFDSSGLTASSSAIVASVRVHWAF